MENTTLFTKIRDNEIPSVKIHSDDRCFVILDINPVIKGHSLVISNEPYRNIGQCPDEVLMHMICVAKRIEARQREVLHCDGSNILINNDPASGQEVPHLHIHVIPRFENDNRRFGFEHDSYAEGEMISIGQALSL